MKNKNTEKRNREPSKLDVLRNMKEQFYESDPARQAGEFVSTFAKTYGGMAIAPYIIPSTLDNPNFIVTKEGNKYGDGGAFAGFTFGLLAGIATDLGQLVAWSTIPMGLHHPEYLAIPIATNLASGAYEWYQETRRNLTRKI